MTRRKKYQKIYVPEDSKREGIDIEYNTQTREITIGGWYDSMVGLEPGTFKLGEFLHKLNITPEDVIQALVDYEIRNHS